MCGGRRAACKPLKPPKPSPPELLAALHVDMFFHVDMFYMLFAAAPVSLPLPLCLFFSLGRSQRRFGGKKKKEQELTVKSEPLSANALFYLA